MAREGLEAGAPGTLPGHWPQDEAKDEFGQLSQGFRRMLDTLRKQRNVIDYSGEMVSATMAGEAVKQAGLLIQQIICRLQENHPELLP